jgi:hypothetical protein
MMKNTIKLLQLTGLFLFISNTLWGQENAKEIFTRASDQLLSENMELRMEMQVKDKRGRVKEKGYEILMARFGEVEKTRMSWEKPEQARGTTVVFTERPGETGLIEVYTPSNGKIRKLKATEGNMQLVGAEAQLTSITAQDPDELSFKLLDPRQVEGKEHYFLEVKNKDSQDQARGELLIEKDSYRIVEIAVFDRTGDQTSTVKLSDFQLVDGHQNKIQPMRIVTEDIKNQKFTDMRVLKIAARADLSEKDFVLPLEGEM